MTQEIQQVPAPEQQVQRAPVAVSPAQHVLAHMPAGLIIASDPGARQGLQFIAKMYADGGLLPEGVTQQGAIILIIAGIDYNLSPIEAISKLYLIGGRVTPSAHELVAQAMRGGVKIEVLESTHELARVKLSRDGYADLQFEYTKADAVKAGLWGKKGPWANDPRSMLMSACKRQAIRLFAPDTLSNMYDADEVSAGTGYIDTAGNFTPDPSITGDQPKVKIEPFVGIKEDKPEPPKPTTKAKPAPKGASDITTEVAAAIGKPAPERPTLEAVMTEAVVPGTSVTKDGRVEAELDRDATVKTIAAKLQTQFGSQEAGRLIKQQLQNAYNAVRSADLTIVQIMAMVMWADQQINADKLKQISASEIPVFDPSRGSATASKTAPITDGVAEDFNAQVLTLFGQFADLDRDEEASAIIEEMGYDEDTSSEQVKRLTAKKLSEKLNAGSQAAD